MARKSGKQSLHEMDALSNMVKEFLVEHPNATQAQVAEYFGHSASWAGKYLNRGVETGVIKVTRYSNPKMYAALSEDGHIFEPVLEPTKAQRRNQSHRLLPLDCTVSERTYYRLEALKKLFTARYKDEIISELVDCYMEHLPQESRAMVDTVAKQIRNLNTFIEDEKESFLAGTS